MSCGVDSHTDTDTLHVAVISDNGGHLADAEFATTAAGYSAALTFLSVHGQVISIGVEGTASYGAGSTHTAHSAGLDVVEVSRPDKAERRRIGKSDPIDAYAARAAVKARTAPSTRSPTSSSPHPRAPAPSSGGSRALTGPTPWPDCDLRSLARHDLHPRTRNPPRRRPRQHLPRPLTAA
ncbi:transposase [Streptomyces sp. NPDC056500]|uniref:IS110 family transposase n=1 Tax=Streptomyces sp. NPDC056500 TaxID=3345840 RepID=UPI003694D3F2